MVQTVAQTVVQTVVQTSLGDWASFYVITGSAAAALTGLQFVVMALVADARGRTDGSAVDAFGTPTIVHFCSVLFVSATLSAPWHVITRAAVAVALCGITGAVYALVIARRTRRQSEYKPVLEDWVWHVVLPFVAYVALFIAALCLTRHETLALFITAGVALLLLFIGIHNAWDSVTYIVAERLPKKQ